jgi:broad specificity phosphatase PhoE
MNTPNDPPLSAAGRVRAIELREALKAKGIMYIFSTNTIRTISTAQPLNELRGATHIEIYNTKDSLDFFIQKLKAIQKGNSLIVGHSNTVDDIVNKLCGETKVPGDLPDSEYDNLYIVTKKGKHYKFENKTYGTPTN